jgi:NlpC/P60 family/S-layer homology domain
MVDTASMRPLVSRVIVLSSMVAALVTIPATSALAFTDVPKSHWAYDAITYVATDNTWMQDYGTDVFEPDTLELREFFARTLVEIWAPSEPIDPTITFDDLPPDDPFYPYANVAVKLDWMRKSKGGFNPDGTVTFKKMDRALVMALGLQAPMDGLDAIHQEDGTAYDTPSKFGAMQLARWLDLHYNHDDESMDLQAKSKVPRDEVAWSVYEAATLDPWDLDGTAVFDDIALPNVTEVQQEFTQYMIDELGPPYIWAGEWDKKSPPGYCCGTQPQGGYDCSGWVWWTLKKNEDGYNAAQYHPDYKGWHLAERSSSDMAANTPTHLKFGDLGPGNLMFFASNGGNHAGDVDHVGIYLGNNWMFHSTGGGPQLGWVGDGWYYDHFVWGRALKSTAPQMPGRAPARTFSPLAGEAPVGP